jgi:hypothetical protein
VSDLEPRELTPDEKAELVALKWNWDGAYQITFETTGDGDQFVARYTGGGRPAYEDARPVMAETVELFRGRVRDDYGLRPEGRGNGGE